MQDYEPEEGSDPVYIKAFAGLEKEPEYVMLENDNNAVVSPTRESKRDGDGRKSRARPSTARRRREVA